MPKTISAKDIKRKISFLLMTAAEVEKVEVLGAMRPLDGENEIIRAVGKIQSYDIGILGRYTVAHVFCGHQGSTREKAAILTAKDAMEEINAKGCVLLGIAYGANKDIQKIGDILISEKIQSYEIVKVATDAIDETGKIRVESRNEVKTPGNVILNQFANFDFRGRSYGIWRGTILSGEKLIDNEKYKSELLDRFSACDKGDMEIIGGEMEGVGLAAALSRTNNSNWIVVKAICDWADGNKGEDKENRQRIAAKNAIDFCKRLFNTDMLTHIDGVRLIRNTTSSGMTDILNGYALFYYRNYRMLTVHKLAKLAKISNDNLKFYESCQEGGEPFHSVPPSTIEKLQNVLECGDLTQGEIIDPLMVKYYKKYKEKEKLYPVSDMKMVVFDFDGTLTQKKGDCSTWQLIWTYLGYSLSDCGLLFRKYTNKEITHQEWCDLTAESFIKKGLSATDVKEIASKIELVDGTIDTIKKIKEKGLKVYICSGSINDVIYNVLGENQALFDGIACNEFNYDANGKLRSIKGTLFDFQGKADFIKKVLRENQILPKDCLFVGNSDNDVWAYESGAKTLVVNPKNITGMNGQEWKYYMEEMRDLHEILPYIFPLDDL